jgi:hypothetical protein
VGEPGGAHDLRHARLLGPRLADARRGDRDDPLAAPSATTPTGTRLETNSTTATPSTRKVIVASLTAANCATPDGACSGSRASCADR